MYGTQDAPAVWQKLVNNSTSSKGFSASSTVACLYFNAETGVRVVAHVDDFLLSGPRKAFVKLREEKNREFEVDGEVLGLDDQ